MRRPRAAATSSAARRSALSGAKARHTTILLDDEAREAVRQLARRHGCSLSEAMRCAIIGQPDTALGLPEAKRRGRRRVLLRWFVLLAGNDDAREVRRLKAEDAGL